MGAVVVSVCIEVRTEGGWVVGADVDEVGDGLGAIERNRCEGRCSEGGHVGSWDGDSVVDGESVYTTTTESRFVRE